MEAEKNTVYVVGAAIVGPGRILVAQRPYSEIAYKSLKWEFPGGKIEPGESAEMAIKREISEELACDVEVDALLPPVEHEYPDFILRITICMCHLKPESTPHCMEHNAIRWVGTAELPSLDWAEADARCYPMVAEWIGSRI